MGYGGCLMCIKVLYNIQNYEKILGGGEGRYFNPKHSQGILRKNDQDEIRTHDLRVRKPALLSIRLNTFAITKYE